MLTELLEIPPSVPSPTTTPSFQNLSSGAVPPAQFHVAHRAVGHARAGLGQHRDLGVVEVHAMGQHRTRPQDPSLVEDVDRPVAEELDPPRPTSSLCSLVWVWMLTP